MTTEHVSVPRKVYENLAQIAEGKMSTHDMQDLASEAYNILSRATPSTSNNVRCTARVKELAKDKRPPGPANPPMWCCLPAGHEGPHKCNFGGIVSPAVPFRDSDEIEWVSRERDTPSTSLAVSDARMPCLGCDSLNCEDCFQHAVSETPEALDAERWRALVGSARVRVLGTAGLLSATDTYGKPWNGYAHIGLELWTKHDAGHEPSDAIECLTRYVEIAMSTQSAQSMACQHEWIDATNSRVSGTALCRKCGKLASLGTVELCDEPAAGELK